MAIIQEKHSEKKNKLLSRRHRLSLGKATKPLLFEHIIIYEDKLTCDRYDTRFPEVGDPSCHLQELDKYRLLVSANNEYKAIKHFLAI